MSARCRSARRNLSPTCRPGLWRGWKATLTIGGSFARCGSSSPSWSGWATTPGLSTRYAACCSITSRLPVRAAATAAAGSSGATASPGATTLSRTPADVPSPASCGSRSAANCSKRSASAVVTAAPQHLPGRPPGEQASGLTAAVRLAVIILVGILVADPERGEARDCPHPSRRAPHGKVYHQ